MNLSKLLHRHRWESVGFEPTWRACLSWGADPIHEFGSVEECQCGERRNLGGSYLTKSVQERLGLGLKYNERGWPLDAQGDECPVAYS